VSGGVPVALAVALSVPDGDAVDVAVVAAVSEAVRVAVCVGLSVRVEEGVAVAVAVRVPVELALAVAVAVAVSGDATHRPSTYQPACELSKSSTVSKRNPISTLFPVHAPGAAKLTPCHVPIGSPASCCQLVHAPPFTRTCTHRWSAEVCPTGSSTSYQLQNVTLIPEAPTKIAGDDSRPLFAAPVSYVQPAAWP
jgi:hypothetical protein